MTRGFLLHGGFRPAIRAMCLWSAALLLAPEAAWPQENTATFYGTVTDPSGAVIPGATYTLTIEAKNFKTYVTSGITLTAGQQIRQAYNLELGTATQTVSVTSSVPLINSVSAQQLHTFQQTEVRQLPLLNRNV